MWLILADCFGIEEESKALETTWPIKYSQNHASLTPHLYSRGNFQMSGYGNSHAWKRSSVEPPQGGAPCGSEFANEADHVAFQSR